MKTLFFRVCAAVVLGTAVGSAVWAAPMVYRGMMPCADCAGIDTTVTLNGDPNAMQGTFSSRLVYMGGRNPRTVNTSGTWTATRGYGTDAGAVVYTLRASNNATPTYYVRSDGSLQMLSRNRQMMPNNGQNHRLTLQTTGSATMGTPSGRTTVTVNMGTTTNTETGTPETNDGY